MFTGKMLQVDHSKHVAEEHVLQLISQAAPASGPVVADARKAGIPVLTILKLMAEFGPQFLSVLEKMLAAIKTPVPLTV